MAPKDQYQTYLGRFSEKFLGLVWLGAHVHRWTSPAAMGMECCASAWVPWAPLELGTSVGTTWTLRRMGQERCPKGKLREDRRRGDGFIRIRWKNAVQVRTHITHTYTGTYTHAHAAHMCTHTHTDPSLSLLGPDYRGPQVQAGRFLHTGCPGGLDTSGPTRENYS